MYDVVIPVYNEEKSILAVLATVLELPLRYIILVLNGCTDRTLELTRSVPDSRIHTIYFSEPLGIDVPRAVGALYARKMNSEGVLFVDGDMSGNIFKNLEELLAALDQEVDVALTNCYPYITDRANLAQLVSRFRANLNKELGLFQALGLATPTHGPHALSVKALEMIPPEGIAIPPLSLVWAAKLGLKTQVATSIRHQSLKSPRKHRKHARLIAETIIGDCIMGFALAHDEPLTRSLGKHQLLGYHPERRFDILNLWNESLAVSHPFCEQHLIIPYRIVIPQSHLSPETDPFEI
ncbi:glycosyltransferase family 2 protein [Desulfitobacterium sp.]|uniref:glycosyltransferase family 2 protein n=1 Tax=Desulfitobacterium sp. TaxID=49981 RepID=UPI002B8966C1|nr:glycosyltransferase [Desulfitobacterium sp.]HVJ50735.1 glycosyltransferase [Desulfitobacterium sp.]